jgi:hypothetical protein
MKTKVAAPLITALSLALINSSAAIAGEDWLNFGRSARGDTIALYAPTVKRIGTETYFSINITDQTGKSHLVDARSADCFKGSKLNGTPRDLSIKKEASWIPIKLNSDATINLVITACRLAGTPPEEVVAEVPEQIASFQPIDPVPSSQNKLGYLVPDETAKEVLSLACMELREQPITIVRVNILERLVAGQNTQFDQFKLDSDADYILSQAVKNCAK